MNHIFHTEFETTRKSKRERRVAFIPKEINLVLHRKSWQGSMT